jgi:hypothetical protein
VKSKHHPLRVNEQELCAWFGRAASGESLIYHRGSLARDRSRTATQLAPTDQAELSRVARRALELAEAGLAELTQRRLGADDYEYRITVKPRPPREGNALLQVLAAELN